MKIRQGLERILTGIAVIGALAGGARSAKADTIAFSTHAGSEGYAVNADGSNLRTVFTGNRVYTSAINPNQDMFAFGSASGVFTVNADGSNRRYLAGGAHAAFPDFSPDGRQIVYSSLFDIYMINSDGTQNRKIAGGSEPVFSPDGSKILFTNWNGWTGDLIIRDLATGLERNITNTPNISETGGDWSVNDLIVFNASQNIPHGRNYDIWIMNSDGNNKIDLTPQLTSTHEMGPCFSPDGNYIAFCSQNSDYSHGRIFTMDIAGRNLSQLSPDYIDAFDPSWVGSLETPAPPKSDVPEPVTALLAGAGIGILALRRKLKRK